MTTKTEPYASKLHKRVDALLFAFIIVIIALLLRPAAKGETLFASAVTSVRQPIWTTLAIFTPKNVTRGTLPYLADPAYGSAEESNARLGLFEAPSSSLPPVAMGGRKSQQVEADNGDLSIFTRSFPAYTQLPPQVQIPGYHSTPSAKKDLSTEFHGTALAKTNTDQL